jgi:hypothetical protein
MPISRNIATSSQLVATIGVRDASYKWLASRREWLILESPPLAPPRSTGEGNWAARRIVGGDCHS